MELGEVAAYAFTFVMPCPCTDSGLRVAFLSADVEICSSLPGRVRT